MKTTTVKLLRAVSTGAVALVLSSGPAGAQSADRPPSGQGSAGQRAGQEAAQAASAEDRAFVTEMSIAGMAEVELGELALQRAEHADVKTFAQMMVKDHTQANTELTQIAGTIGAAPARELDQKHRELEMKLSTLKGVAFDRAYMDAMVSGHEEVLMKLQQRTGAATRAEAPVSPAPGSAAPGAATAGAAGAPGQGRDPGQAVGTGGTAAGRSALDQWAAKAAPVVKQHLQRARDIQKAVAQTTR